MLEQARLETIRVETSQVEFGPIPRTILWPVSPAFLPVKHSKTDYTIHALLTIHTSYRLMRPG